MSQRALWRVLVASLCVNALLVGYVGVQWLGPPSAFTRALPPETAIVRFAQRLPQDDRAVLLSAFAEREAEFARDRPEFAKVYKRLAAAFSRQEIDAEEVRRAAADLVDLNSRAMRLVTDVFVEAIPKFSPETKRLLAKRFDQ